MAEVHRHTGTYERALLLYTQGLSREMGRHARGGPPPPREEGCV